MMIRFRPMRSDMAPKMVKNGMPSSRATATVMRAASVSTLRMVVR